MAQPGNDRTSEPRNQGPTKAPQDPTVRPELMSTVPVTVAVADLVTLTDPVDTPLAEAREAPHVQALVEAARRGSREAFADLVALNERVVFRTALAALRVREDAEDAMDSDRRPDDDDDRGRKKSHRQRDACTEQEA